MNPSIGANSKWKYLLLLKLWCNINGLNGGGEGISKVKMEYYPRIIMEKCRFIIGKNGGWEGISRVKMEEGIVRLW